jgi:hypothetical protein
MITYPILVTNSEKELVDAIQEVEFGELQNVELIDSGQPPNITVEVTRQTKDLLTLTSEIRFFHSIRIHQGEPTVAEVPFTTKCGFRARKLYRFNV